MAHAEPPLHVLILAGGIGSRFWPASTASRPKQLLSLSGPRSLIEETVERARTLAPPERIRILTGYHLVEPIRRALPEALGRSFLVEPHARGTAPVLAWAAWLVAREDPDAIILSLHSDHLIRPPEEFTRTLRAAAQLATDQDMLVAVAVPPSRPETGYGYIRPGEPLPVSEGERGLDGFRVEAFVEKPDATTARLYLEKGCLWNSGIFAWTAHRFLEEVRTHAPEVGEHLSLLEEDDAEGFFQAVSPISVDEAVLERSGRVASVRATFEWDDVGSWEALTRTRSADSEGNVTVGSVQAVESSGNIVYAEGGPVVLFGAENLVVVRTRGATFVTPRERTGDLKELFRHLSEELRDPEESTE